MGALPLIVVEGTGAAFDDAIAEVERSGTRIGEGFDTFDGAPVRAGVVATSADAERALQAALRGCGLVVAVEGLRGSAATFIDDLQRVRAVDIRSRGRVGTRLDVQDCELVRLLAAGSTVTDAAQTLHVSVRTAQRRLGAVRAALHVRSTAEAVHVAMARKLC